MKRRRFPIDTMTPEIAARMDAEAKLKEAFAAVARLTAHVIRDSIGRRPRSR